MTSTVALRNNVKISGRGPQTILFAHGFGCDQNMWRSVAPAFEDEFQVVLFDYVGSGRSGLQAYDPKRYATLEGYALDVLDICKELDLANVIFVGHSVSSVIGILAAIEQPARFERLILIGPSPCYINDETGYVGGFERSDIEELLSMMDKNYIGWANFLGPAVMANLDRPELAAELTDSFCSTDPDIARRFAEATFLSDYRAELPKLTVPSLIMQCSDDIIAPLAVGHYLDLHLPHSTLKVLQATGHCPQLSHPEETTRVIQEYLSDR